MVPRLGALLLSVALPLLTACTHSPSDLGVGRNDPIELHFIDVGEGDAILVRLGVDRAHLVDTGNLTSAPVIARHLESSGITAIDTLLLTHPHLDHVGGAYSLVQSIPVRAIRDNGEDLTERARTEDAYRWYQEAIRADVRYRAIEHGAQLDCAPARCLVLGGRGVDPVARDWNANSLALFVEYGEFTALLMGDGNTTTEKWLLSKKNHASLAGVDLLKAGHHGAADTASAPFLQKIRPSVVVVSVNKNNVRGYPAPATIARFAASGARVLSTAERGTIVVRAWRNGRMDITSAGGNP